MTILTQLNKRTQDYSDKLLEQLRSWTPRHRWDASHRRARGYAGGKASPKKQPELTFSNKAELMAALQDGVLGQANDDDITRMHEMCHRLMVEKGGPGSGHHGHRGVPGQRGGSAPSGGGVGGGLSLGDVPESHSSIYHDNPRGDPVGAGDALMGWGEGDRRKIGNGALYMYNRAGSDNLMVLRDDGESVGVAALSKYDSQNPFSDVQGTYVEVGYIATKRSGYGRSLMKSVIQKAAEENKGVFLQSVPDAVGFYEAIGMKLSTQANYKRLYYWTPQEIQELSKAADNDEPENGVFVAEPTRAGKDTAEKEVDAILLEELNKGGPGSGHRGHRGIPGQRGGSAPSGGAGGVAVDLSRSDKSTVEFVLNSVPESHRARLQSITNDPPEDYPGWKVTVEGEEMEALGAYNAGTGTIHLNPNNRTTVATFHHEMGHHVFLKSDWVRSESGQRAAKVIGGKHGEASGMGGKLYNLGLTRNSVINPQEFGADCWKVFAKGRPQEKQALSKFLGADLDGLFGD